MLHRSMYMGERQRYYSRRSLAMTQPSKYWSFICDGEHCLLDARCVVY
jgi:hypothetical protein